MQICRLDPEQLRWQCDESWLDFETTEQVDSASEIIGQELAREALEFGLLCTAPGQNIFVRGTRGTGRLTIVRRMLKDLAPTTSSKRDICFVHNFRQPDRPRLVVLKPGQGPEFRKQIRELASFIVERLKRMMDSEPFLSQRQTLDDQAQERIAGITAPFEKELAENRMALITVQQGPVSAPVIVPLVGDQPVAPEKFREMIKSGEADAAQLEQFRERYPACQKRLAEIGRRVNEAWQEAARELEQFNRNAAREILSVPSHSLIAAHGESPGVKVFIEELIDNAIDRLLGESDENGENGQQEDLLDLYDVNVVLTHDEFYNRPVVEELVPTAMNLLGTVEQRPGPGGMALSDYRGIRAGAILKADQGYLILNIDDLLEEPHAYQSLMRTLRTRRLEIVPQESSWMRPYVVVLPEPVDIDVRVILIGNASTWYKLDRLDPDFRDLFKVLADFDDELPRERESVMQYAVVLARLARDEKLPHFHRTAVAALAEHGARIVARGDKLTARFGRIADLAREAAFLASHRDKTTVVTGEHVREAVSRTKKRASLPTGRFQELIDNGTIIVDTEGTRIGQINGLAVMQAGPLTYGFPARITCAMGPGRAGLVNIEGTARMSGAIHTKGFHILGGLLMNLLRLPHPLAFSASLAFEQSYGGIDGDSASAAEMLCLLSALTDVPLRQDLAITGAVDQHGNIQSIGGVNEKIEGFFDVCEFRGLTGTQGVVIPFANAPDLMLRHNVREACRIGEFSIFTVENIGHAIELMTGMPSGFGQSPPAAGTVLHIAVERAGEFWKKTLSSPGRLTTVERGDGEG
jgi:lon-related putative ATP-dependent protease